MSQTFLSVIRELARLREQAWPDGPALLGSRPQYTHKHDSRALPWAARVHIALRDIPRQERYSVLTALFGRLITSAKDLTVAEASALWTLHSLGYMSKLLNEIGVNSHE